MPVKPLGKPPYFLLFLLATLAGSPLCVSANNLVLEKVYLGMGAKPGEVASIQYKIANRHRSGDLTSTGFTDDLSQAIQGLIADSLPMNPCGPSSVVEGRDVVTLSGASIASGQECVFVVDVLVPTDASPGSYGSSTSAVSGLLDGIETSGNSAFANLEILFPVDFSASALTDPVAPGARTTIRYSVVNNSTTAALSDFSFTQELPAELSYVPSPFSSGGCGPSVQTTASIPEEDGPSVVDVSGGQLNPGSNCYIDVSVDVSNAAGNSTHVLTSSDFLAVAAGDTISVSPAQATLDVVSAPDLRLTASPLGPEPGEVVTLSVELNNHGESSQLATEIAFAVQVPNLGSGTLSPVALPQGVCGGISALDFNALTSILDFEGGILPSGQTCSFDVHFGASVSASPGEYAFSSGFVTSLAGGLPTSSRATTAPFSITGLSLSQQFDGSFVEPGESVTVRYSLENKLPTDAVSDIAFVVDLGAAITGLQAASLPDISQCGPGASLIGMPDATRIEFALPSLSAGDVCEFAMSLAVPATTFPSRYNLATEAFSGYAKGTEFFPRNATTELLVGDMEALPSAPEDLAAQWASRTPMALTLSWLPPSDGSPIDGFLLVDATNDIVIAETSVPQFEYQIGESTPRGDIDFEVRAIDVAGLVSDPSELSWTIPYGSVAEGDDPAPESDFDELVDLHRDNSSQVGATVGTFRVDETGNANYSVGILTGPSRGDLVPGLGLTYNSSRGNGDVGIGWSIAGQSAITRCAQTYEQDGPDAVLGIQVESTDRFCLDGERLVLVPGSGAYGDADSEYRLERDPFTKIEAKGQAGNGPNWFKVYRRDGSVSSYGNSASSRIRIEAGSAPVTVLTWAVNEVKDSADNSMSFEYCSSNDSAQNPTSNCPSGTLSNSVEYHLKTVKYGGDASNQPNRIEFIWSERVDQSVSYLKGAELTSTYLLQRIDSYSTDYPAQNEQLIRSYRLSYDPQGDGYGRSILTEIQECADLAATTCFPPLTFDWNIDTSGFAGTGPVLFPIGSTGGDLANFAENYLAGRPADLDGDGLQDFVYLHDDNTPKFGVVRVNDGAGGTSLQFRRKITNQFGDAYLPDSIVTGSSGWHILDIDLDGRDDILYQERIGDTRQWTALFSTETFPHVGTDPVSVGVIGSWTGTGAEVAAVTISDVDADGMADIVFLRDGKMRVSRNQGGAFANPVVMEFVDPNLEQLAIDIRQLIGVNEGEMPGLTVVYGPSTQFDYNSDGAADLLVKVVGNVSFDASDNPPQFSAPILSQAEYEAQVAANPLGEDQGRYSAWYLATAMRDSLGTLSYQFTPTLIAMADDCENAGPTNPTIICNVGGWQRPQVQRIQAADINGDGLADLVTFADVDPDTNMVSAKDSVHYWLNKGDGFPSDLTNDPFSELDGINNAQFANLVDYDGDGLLDILHPEDNEADEDTKWHVRLNSYLGYGPTSEATFALARNIDASDDEQDNVDSSIFFDANGDGRLDQILINRDDQGRVRNNSQYRVGIEAEDGTTKAPRNVIEKFIGSYGDYARIDYEPLTEDAVYERDCITDMTPCGDGGQGWGSGATVYDVVAPIYVVAAAHSRAPAAVVTYNDATDSFGIFDVNKDAESTILYGYRGAKIQAGGRGFLGFREIDSIDVQSAVATTTKYRQDFPYASHPYETTTMLGTTTLSSSTTNWSQIAGPGGSVLVYQDDSEDYNYDIHGNLTNRIVTDNVYNTAGNLTYVSLATYDGDGTNLVERKETTNTYDDNLTKWHLGRLVRADVKTTLDDLSHATRVSTFTYDTSSGILDSETVEPGHALEVHTKYGLSTHGVRESVEVVTAAGTRTSSMAYDPSGRFVLTTTNALGQIESTVNDYDAWGNPLNTTNIRGIETVHAYDLMGRKMGSYAPTGEFSVTYYSENPGSCPSAQTSFTFRETTVAGSGATATICYDVLGREFRKTHQAIGNGGAISTVVVDTEYDHSGRVIRTSEPAFSDATTQYWTSTAFNALGQPEAIRHPNYGRTKIEYLPGNQVETTDPLNHVRTETRNGLGETLEVREYNDHLNVDQWAIVTFEERFEDGQRVKTVTGADGAVVESVFDVVGNKVQIDDPDKGLWRYAYNAFGELVCHVSAKGTGSRNSYDVLGRKVETLDGWVSSIGSTDCTIQNPRDQVWIYDVTANQPESGLLQSEAICQGYPFNCGDEETFIREFDYDEFGRPMRTETSFLVLTTPGDPIQQFQQFVEEVTYDPHGRVFQMFDASGLLSGVEYVYNSIGVRTHVKDAVTGNVHEEIFEMDARGNATLTYFNDQQFSESRLFDPATGLPGSSTGSAGTGQWLDFDFDLIGNLRQRISSTATGTITEDFEYDDFNRVVEVDLQSPAGSRVNTFQYDVAGNLLFKQFAGANSLGGYFYDQAHSCGHTPGPHAPTTVGSTTYCYDENGNRVSSSDGEQLTYTAFEKVKGIINPAAGSTQYFYGPNRTPYMKTESDLSSSKTTVFLGAVEAVVSSDGNWQYRRTVGRNTLLTSHNGNQGSFDRTVLLKDHLGSVNAMVGGDGLLIEQMSFDAWGLRRDVSDPLVSAGQALIDTFNAITNEGYGGHEMLDQFQLVNMGGRVYDPVLGRFLQADPFVQSPKNAQNLNRYAYVLNNPLSYTDPTGYFYEDLKKYWRPIAAIVITAFAPYVGGWLAGSGAAAGGAAAGGAAAGGIGAAGSIATGFVAGAVGSGSFRGGLIGAFSAGLFGQIHVGFDKYGKAGSALGTELSAGTLAAKVVAHGVAGGIMSELQGGKFGHGFVSAGLAQASSGPISQIGPSNISGMPARVITAAVVGGSASSLTGGKFANGAVTAAFARAFNDEKGRPDFEYDRRNPEHHWYSIEDPICSLDRVCTMSTVARANLTHPAPGTLSRTTPVENGEESVAQLGYDFEFDDLGPVVHTVSPDGLSVRNTALPGHKLFPGYVERTVFRRGNSVYIRTVGEGVGPMGALNVSLADELWNGLVNSHVRYRVNLGYRNE